MSFQTNIVIHICQMVSSNTSRSNLIINSQLKRRSAFSCPKAAICCRQVISNCFFKSFFLYNALCNCRCNWYKLLKGLLMIYLSSECSASFPGCPFKRKAMGTRLQSVFHIKSICCWQLSVRCCKSLSHGCI